jgi:hypothetical protein
MIFSLLHFLINQLVVLFWDKNSNEKYLKIKDVVEEHVNGLLAVCNKKDADRAMGFR